RRGVGRGNRSRFQRRAGGLHRGSRRAGVLSRRHLGARDDARCSMSDTAMVGAPGAHTFGAMFLKELREGLRPFLVSLAFVAIGLLFSLSMQRLMSASGA